MKQLKLTLSTILCIMIVMSSIAQETIMSYEQQFIKGHEVSNKNDTVKIDINKAEGSIVVTSDSETLNIKVLADSVKYDQIVTLYCITQKEEYLMVDLILTEDNSVIRELVIYRDEKHNEGVIQNYKIKL